jgi:CheY-like chemotaxis protein
VHAASDVDSALALLDSVRPDVLVSDIGMPGKDGYALMREIRRAEPPGRRVPAIALTAFSRQQDIDQALAAGFDAHCAKPLRPLELLRLIARVTGPRERPAGPATTA